MNKVEHYQVDNHRKKIQKNVISKGTELKIQNSVADTRKYDN